MVPVVAGDPLPRVVHALGGLLDPSSTELVVVTPGAAARRPVRRRRRGRTTARWPRPAARRPSLLATAVLGCTGNRIACLRATAEPRQVLDLLDALDHADLAVAVAGGDTVTRGGERRAVPGATFAVRAPAARLLVALGAFEDGAGDARLVETANRLRLRAVEVAAGAHDTDHGRPVVRRAGSSGAARDLGPVDAPDRGAGARPLLRRAARRTSAWMGRHPTTLPLVLGATPHGRARQVGPHTDLVVEGFRRTGTAFVVAALRGSTHRALTVSSPVHHPAQVLDAVRHGVPTVLVVRHPVPTVASLLVACPDDHPRAALARYVAHHRALLGVLDDVEVAEFESFTRDLGALVDRLNARWDLDLPPFVHDADHVDAVLDSIDDQHLLTHDGGDPERAVARPSRSRALATARWRSELRRPELAGLLAAAEGIHALLAGRVPCEDRPQVAAAELGRGRPGR